MKKAEKIQQELIDKLNHFFKEFENLDLIDVHSKEFNEKFYAFFDVFCQAVDAKRDTYYKMVGLTELSEEELLALATSKLASFDKLSAHFFGDAETEHVINKAHKLIGKIIKKKSTP